MIKKRTYGSLKMEEKSKLLISAEDIDEVYVDSNGLNIAGTGLGFC